MGENLKIPDDLINWHSIAVRERTSDFKHIYTAEDCIVLIERVALVEERNEHLREALTAMIADAHRSDYHIRRAVFEKAHAALEATK